MQREGGIRFQKTKQSSTFGLTGIAMSCAVVWNLKEEEAHL